jgi:hypothetical protein
VYFSRAGKSPSDYGICGDFARRHNACGVAGTLTAVETHEPLRRPENGSFPGETGIRLVDYAFA